MSATCVSSMAPMRGAKVRLIGSPSGTASITSTMTLRPSVRIRVRTPSSAVRSCSQSPNSAPAAIASGIERSSSRTVSSISMVGSVLPVVGARVAMPSPPMARLIAPPTIRPIDSST